MTSDLDPQEQQILDELAAFVVVWGEYGELIWWNRVCGEMTALGPFPLKTGSIEAFVPSTHIDIATAFLQRVWREGACSETYPMLLHDGEIIHTRWSARRIDRAGRSLVLGVGQSLLGTLEQKWVLRGVAPPEAEVRLEDAIWVDDTLHIVDIFPGAAFTFRGTLEDLRGFPFLELIAPRDRSTLRRELHKLQRGEGLALKSSSIPTLQGMRRDGELIPLSLWAVHAPREGTGGYVLVVQRTRELQRVAWERQHAIALVESIVSTDTGADAAKALAEQCVPALADFCYIELIRNGNHAFARHRDDEKSAILEELCRLRLLGGRRNPIRRVLEQGRGRVYPSLTPRTVASIANSAQKRALLDQLCPRSLWLMPLRGRSETIGVVALFREQPGAYAAGLQEFGAELGRAAGLAIDLVRSLEGKRRAIEARDYVLGVVAHDLRNPISTIALATKALRLELNEHAALVESKLSLVEKTALQMKILVGDLLQVARLESGLLQVSPVYLDACALVEEVAGSALPLAAAAALQLIVEKPAKPLWVFADPQRLSQALSNLLSNAVKFTPRGGWVRLQLTEFGSKAKFLVEDSGPGIPPAEQQHLFAPFWQSNGGAMEGAGLGLFIASGLVAAHGGKLRVDSALGHGSRFWFQLPRCEEAGSVATSSRPAEFPLPSCGALLVETRAETPSRH